MRSPTRAHLDEWASLLDERVPEELNGGTDNEDSQLPVDRRQCR